ncbi:hypothetical protein HanRHA438_Chr12g0559421 [Helianthus annuus]|nr:hypothetical protein HanIR_Chr12g0591271 [Helianthus annuus]KAJ0867113.1 hypothetical protein HanRHA438_Chr12g0559421 [Helianthus annuus]
MVFVVGFRPRWVCSQGVCLNASENGSKSLDLVRGDNASFNRSFGGLDGVGEVLEQCRRGGGFNGLILPQSKRSSAAEMEWRSR